MAGGKLEYWKPIKGYEDFYQVSNLGDIKSLFRLIKTGENKRSVGERLLKQNTNRYGYKMVSLSKDSVLKTVSVHRLVGIAFVDNTQNKSEINHIDGNKSNNEIHNLEWCTKSENNKHSLKLGLRVTKKGIEHYNSRFKEEDIINIRNSNLSESNLSNLYNVNRATIGKIKRFERYKNIS